MSNQPIDPVPGEIWENDVEALEIGFIGDGRVGVLSDRSSDGVLWFFSLADWHAWAAGARRIEP